VKVPEAPQSDGNMSKGLWTTVSNFRILKLLLFLGLPYYSNYKCTHFKPFLTFLYLGLKIDGFGECFDNVLIDSPWSHFAKEKTNWGPFAKYKFYFAFENSIHCNDYLSEKFWRNSLSQGLVPVVYGPHPDDVKVRVGTGPYKIFKFTLCLVFYFLFYLFLQNFFFLYFPLPTF